VSQAVRYCLQVVGPRTLGSPIAVTMASASATLTPGECYQSGRSKLLPKGSVAQLSNGDSGFSNEDSGLSDGDSGLRVRTDRLGTRTNRELG
jgi:hypothetical protein